MPIAPPREPRDDAPIDALRADERRAIAAIFDSRASSELHIAAIFASFTRSLLARGAEATLVQSAADAVGDEVRHAGLWTSLARRYDGDRPDAVRKELALPRHPGFTPEDELVLQIVSLSCLNETIATARLEEMIWAARGDSLRFTLRTILSDEIGHARLGWALLASPRTCARTREMVSAAMPGLLTASVHGLLAGPEFRLPNPAPLHSISAREDVIVVFAAAVRDLVIPGLRHVQVDPDPASRWLAQFRAAHPLPAFAHAPESAARG